MERAQVNRLALGLVAAAIVMAWPTIIHAQSAGKALVLYLADDNEVKKLEAMTVLSERWHAYTEVDLEGPLLLTSYLHQQGSDLYIRGSRSAVICEQGEANVLARSSDILHVLRSSSKETIEPQTLVRVIENLEWVRDNLQCHNFWIDDEALATIHVALGYAYSLNGGRGAAASRAFRDALAVKPDFPWVPGFDSHYRELFEQHRERYAGAGTVKERVQGASTTKVHLDLRGTNFKGFRLDGRLLEAGDERLVYDGYHLLQWNNRSGIDGVRFSTRGQSRVDVIGPVGQGELLLRVLDDDDGKQDMLEANRILQTTLGPNWRKEYGHVFVMDFRGDKDPSSVRVIHFQPPSYQVDKLRTDEEWEEFYESQGLPGRRDDRARFALMPVGYEYLSHFHYLRFALDIAVTPFRDIPLVIDGGAMLGIPFRSLSTGEELYTMPGGHLGLGFMLLNSRRSRVFTTVRVRLIGDHYEAAGGGPVAIPGGELSVVVDTPANPASAVFGRIRIRFGIQGMPFADVRNGRLVARETNEVVPYLGFELGGGFRLLDSRKGS